AAAGGAWWYVNGRQQAPDWDRVPDIALAAPAGDAFRDDTPWVALDLAPAKPGEANTVRLAVRTREGTPTPSMAASTRIADLTVQAISGSGEPQTLALQPDPGISGAV